MKLMQRVVHTGGPLPILDSDQLADRLARSSLVWYGTHTVLTMKV